MKTSIIIVNYNTLDLLKDCVKSIKKYTKDYELIIVNNGLETNETRKFIIEEADKYIFNNINLGFAKANNQGSNIADGELICFLNSDTIVTKDWLDEMIKTMEKLNCVAIGPLGNPQQKEFQGTTWKYQQYVGQYKEDVLVTFLSGFCLLIKKDVFDLIRFDEDFELGLFEDNLLCDKIKKMGLKMGISHKSLVKHIGSASFKKNDINYINLLNKNKLVYQKKLKQLYG